MTTQRPFFSNFSHTIARMPTWMAMMLGTLSVGSGIMGILMAAQIVPILPVLIPLALTAPFMAVLGAIVTCLGLGIFFGLGLLSHPQKVELINKRKDNDDDILHVDVDQGLDLSDDKESTKAITASNSTPSFSQKTPDKAPIITLPGDVASLIAFSTLRGKAGDLPSDAGSLARTCKFFAHTLKNSLNDIRTVHVSKLVQHVVYGEKNQVEAMLKANPSLLQYRAMVTDYSGRTIKASAYQAALGAMDNDMARMIEPYFAQLKRGEQERIAQYNKQFPKGLPKPAPYDFSTLVDIIAASTQDEIEAQLNLEVREDSQICQAINKFRAHLEPSGVIESGLYFNDQTLVKAFEVLYAQSDSWSWPNAPKLDLFWRQVIGYVQRFIPACDAQAFAQGLYGVEERRDPLIRNFRYKQGRGSIFPLHDDAQLGFQVAVVGGRTSSYMVWREVRQGACRMYMAKKRREIKGLSRSSPMKPPGIASVNS